MFKNSTAVRLQSFIIIFVNFMLCSDTYYDILMGPRHHR